jgi:hypothetical protein
MSTIGVLQDLTGFFLSAGIIGAAVAILCALIALIALALGSAAFAGGAVAVWIGGALLSLTSGFSGQWLPAILAGGSLVVALVLGGVARALVRALQAREKAAPAEVSESAAIVVPAVAAPAVAAPAVAAIAQSARQLSVRTATPESIR